MIAASLLLLLLPLPQSSSSSPLTIGTRVRVTVREDGSERRLVGPLRTFDSEALALTTEDGGERLSLPRANITRIEVSRGSRSHAGKGFLVGAVLGLAAIAVVEAAHGDNYEAPDNYGLIVAGSVAGGALVGAGIGALMRSERWEAQPWAVGPGRRAGTPVSVNIVSLRF